MNLKKYKRLCVVVFLPLLIIGVLGSLLFWPYPKSAVYYCEARNEEYCRNGGELGSHISEIIKSQQPSWFPITISTENSLDPIYVFFGSFRTVHSAEVIKTVTYVGHSQAATDFMNGLIGRTVSIFLGPPEGGKSVVTERNALLYCNDLTFELVSGTYTSRCWGDGWGGPITFSVEDASQDRNMLDQLKVEIDRKIKDMRIYHIIYMIVVYPIFFYGFLLLSLLYWLGIQAVRYIRNADRDQNQLIR
ncbi:hypothetical protein [Pseudomonas juntendi]|uniref:Uncharacterized protein n=1 Tax=Pseudomonas juntendi TaxID=2666183 RepID=A0AAJ5V245_9PSED|nr:hypothetical protein [Pseudomonas juntendi]WEA23718.1 hypothetical protein PWA60_28670 [Pseudomonas juntendi]